MLEPTLRDVRDALERGQKDAARAMIDIVLTKTPTAEGWVLAARTMDSPADKLICLEKALELDPNHQEAREAYQALGKEPPPMQPRRNAEPAIELPEDDDDPFDIGSVRREGDTSVTVEGVYEMLWDCKYCGTKKLLGKTQKFCPTCGAQQDADWRYYPSDEEKVAVKDHRFVGADKVCPNCSSLNVADAEFCTRCGAPQSAAAEVKAQAARAAHGTTGAGSGIASFMTEDLDARQMAEKFPHLAKTAAAPRQRPRWLLPAIGAVVLAIVAFAAFAIFAKREETGYVTAFDWERTIDVERYVAINESQVCPAPLGAYNVTSRREQVGSRSVPDGEECFSQQVDQGDGTFRQERVCQTRYRSEPVYGDMCYFTINRWGYSRTAQATGADALSLAWPVTNLNSSSLGGTGGCNSLTPILGCEREGGRNERYSVVLTGDGGKTYTCDLPLNEWQSITLETTFTFQVRVVGGGIDCSTLQRTG